jgi:hypothetical protein
MILVSRIVLALLATLGAVYAGRTFDLVNHFDSSSYAYTVFGIIVFLAFAVGWMVGRRALLARLTEVEGERDEARRRLLGETSWSYWSTRLERHDAERSALAAENARLRQQVGARDEVVEAATMLLWLKDGPRDDDYRERKPKTWAALRAALDALPEGPAGPPPSTLPPEQAEVVHGTTDGPAEPTEAQGGPGSVDLMANLKASFKKLRGEGRSFAEPATETDQPPADSPWLEEAIEAGWAAVDINGSGIDAAIRAALPLIAAGVLREAADEWNQRCDELDIPDPDIRDRYDFAARMARGRASSISIARYTR